MVPFSGMWANQRKTRPGRAKRGDLCDLALPTQFTLPQFAQAQLPSTPSLGAPLGHRAEGAWPDWMAQIRSSRTCCGGLGVEQRWHESRVPKLTFLQPVQRLRQGHERNHGGTRARPRTVRTYHAPSTPS